MIGMTAAVADRCLLNTQKPNQQDLDKLRALPPDDARYKEIPPRYHQARPSIYLCTMYMHGYGS